MSKEKMKTRRAKVKIPKFTCIEEIPHPTDYDFVDFPQRLTCDFCLRKIEIGNKKDRVQKPVFGLIAKISKCEQRWSDDCANKPSIADRQAELHVLSCRCAKVEPRCQLNAENHECTRKSQKTLEESSNTIPLKGKQR